MGLFPGVAYISSTGVDRQIAFSQAVMSADGEDQKGRLISA